MAGEALAFHFSVTFGASPLDPEASFVEVSGVSAEMETESVTEGGRNDFIHRLPKPVKHPSLVLRRGLAPMDSPLVTWCRETLERGLALPIEPRDLQVRLLDRAGETLRQWAFRNAYPVKWEVDAFNSQRNELAMERVELAYSNSVREK